MVPWGYVSRLFTPVLNVAWRRVWVSVLVVAAATAALLWPAVLNGYPFVYWDTGAYIWSSLDLIVPVDRPIGYGLFIGASRGLLQSLWLPVVVQSIATAVLLMRALMLVVHGTYARRVALSLCVVVLTATTTALPRFATFVMPDVLSGWVVLGGLLLVLGSRRLDRIAGGMAIVAAVLVHNGNLLLAVACGVVFAALAAARLTGWRSSLAPLAVVIAVGLPLAILVNVVLGAGVTVSRGGPTFLVNRLASTGVLSDTLSAYCPGAGWLLCGAQDVIRQPHADPNWWFLWGDDSPLQQIGWEQGGGEQSDIVRHAITCCFARILTSSAEASWQQIQQFSAREDLPRLDGSAGAFNAIRLIYPRDFGAYLTSDQQVGRTPRVELLPGDDLAVYGAFAIAAILVLASCLRRGLRRAAMFLLVALGAVVLNAVISGGVNGPADRQQGRIAWLLPCAVWAGAVALTAAGDRHVSAAPGSFRGSTRHRLSGIPLLGGWVVIGVAVAVAVLATVATWSASPRPLDPDAQQYVDLAHAALIFGTYREPLWIALLCPVEAVLGPSRDAARAVGVLGFIGLVVAFGVVSWRLCGRSVGGVLTLLVAATPWLAFQATRGLREEMAAAGLVLVAGAVGQPQWLRNGRGVLLGGAVGAVGLLRWDTLAVAIPLLVLGCWRTRASVREWGPGAAALGSLVLLLPVMNAVTVGDPLAHTNEHATFFAFLEFGWTRLPDSPTLSWTTYVFGLHAPLEVASRVVSGAMAGPVRVFEAALHAPVWVGGGLVALTWLCALALRNTPAWPAGLAFVLTSLEFAFIAQLMDERLGLALLPLALLTLGAAVGQTLSVRPASHSRQLGVAMVIERYYPYVAGAERQVQARGPALAGRDAPMTVITRMLPGLSRYTVVADAPVHRLRSSGGRVLGSLTFIFGALRLVRRQRNAIRVVHAYSLFSPTMVGILARLTLGTPVVAELLGGGATGDLAVLRRLRSGRLRIWLMRHVVDRFIALSDEVEAGLRGVGIPAAKVARITNGVDVAYFSPAPMVSASLPPEPVVLYVGRLHREKGVDLLINAWPQVLAALPQARLVLVGDGPLRAELETRAGERVCFAGLTDDPLPFLQSAGCFVLPSRSEGLPVALLEAMAVGLPSVATSVGGNVDVIRDGVDGWLVAPENPSALARGIVHALCAPDRLRVGCAARARVVRDFSLDRTADQLASLYRELTSSA
ncbi:MAG: hypothetical protein NVSMB2_12840 [Chloroflexota bacterium]